MYKKAYIGKKEPNNKYKIFLWEENSELQVIDYNNDAYQECDPEKASKVGLNGEPLKLINARSWKFSKNPNYSNQEIKIKLKSYNHQLVDTAIEEIVGAVTRTGSKVVGPIPMPTSIEKFTF